MPCLTSRPRLLIVPGLRNSGPAHWQTWLQSLHRDAVRVEQTDWETPDLDRWADRITDTLASEADGPWLVAAHSFGSLAVAHHLATQVRTPLRAALLVAPADPAKFGLDGDLPQLPLPVPTTLIASDSDPWMRAATARFWAHRWGARCLSLGNAGHSMPGTQCRVRLWSFTPSAALGGVPRATPRQWPSSGPRCCGGVAVRVLMPAA